MGKELTCPTCKTTIKDHPANACLDALFAEMVMGWKEKEVYKESDSLFKSKVWCDSKIYGIRKYWVDDWSPSTNISHVMEGVEKRRCKHGFHHGWFEMSIRPTGWCVNLTGNRSDNVYAETAPLAITRALVMWAMGSQK